MKRKQFGIKDLDNEQSAILNKRGWFLVTYYQCRKNEPQCKSYDLAISFAVNKSKSASRDIGIRINEKKDHIAYEIWDHWK